MSFEAHCDGLRRSTFQLCNLSIRCRQAAIDNAVGRAGIAKHVSIHSLRHPFATHAPEQGTDLRFIQALPGHSSVKTTEIHTDVSNTTVTAIQSPIEKLFSSKT